VDGAREGKKKEKEKKEEKSNAAAVLIRDKVPAGLKGGMMRRTAG